MSSNGTAAASFVDISNSPDSKIPIDDLSTLDAGTQVSCVCFGSGAKFDHHGVFVGRLDLTKESHLALLRQFPLLKGQFCVVDKTGDHRNNSIIQIRTASEFANKTTIYAHLYKIPVYTPEEVVHRALLRLTQKDTSKYDEISNNCEHFATEIVRGTPQSHQSDAVQSAVVAGANAAIMGAAVGGGATTAIGLSSVVIAETVTVPLFGLSILGNLGLTSTAVATSTVTAFEAGVVTAGAVVGTAMAGAVLAAAVIGYAAYNSKKNGESKQRQLKQRKDAESKAVAVLEKLKFNTKAVNIAFCGGTGRGKSSCVNALLGSDAAHVSASGEGTTEIIRHELQLDSQAMVLWDLPGAGTVAHPEGTYWTDKALSCYHVLLVFLEMDTILDFERNIVQRAISERNPPVALVFGRADTASGRLQRKGVAPKEAAAALRAAASKTVQETFKMHPGDPPPPSFVVSQKLWRRGEHRFDENKLVAFLLRKTIDDGLPVDEINAILTAMKLPPLDTADGAAAEAVLQRGAGPMGGGKLGVQV